MSAVMPIEADQRTIRLDADLQGIDELAARYYRGQFDGGQRHPLETIRLMHDGAVLGGAPEKMADDELAFDKVRATAPQRERLTLDCWYLTSGSAKQKAQRLSISRATLYLHWKAALGYFRGRLHEKGILV
jgi:hypothetical protein